MMRQHIDRVNAEAFHDWGRLLGGKEAVATIVIGVSGGADGRIYLYGLPTLTKEQLVAILREAADQIETLTPRYEVPK